MTSPAIPLDLSLEGNVVPLQWFHHIRDEQDRPDLHAILILSDIVYWYRPVQIRDEQTSQITRYRPAFQQALLQKSYECYRDLLGLSETQVKEAFARLERLGLIRCLPRHSDTSSNASSQGMFIELKVDKVQKISRFQDREDHPILSLPVSPLSSSDTKDHLSLKVAYPSMPKIVSDGSGCWAAQMIDLWNQTFAAYPPASLTYTRKRALLSVLSSAFAGDLTRWQQFCHKVQGSAFLQGQGTRGWRASLDWCVEETNLRKIQEGQYENKDKIPPLQVSPEISLQRAQDHINTLSGDHQRLARVLCETLGAPTYLSWFQSMTFLCQGTEKPQIQLGFPSRFMTSYVNQHHREVLIQLLTELYGSTLSLDLVVHKTYSNTQEDVSDIELYHRSSQSFVKKVQYPSTNIERITPQASSDSQPLGECR